MSSAFFRCAGLSILVLVGIGSLTVVDSQETAEPVDASLEIEAEGTELALVIEAKHEELERLGEQMSTAVGDDVKALRERAIELMTEYLLEIGAFGRNIVEREGQGIDATEDRQTVTERSQRISELLRSSVEKTQKELNALRRSTEGASPEELEQVERDLAVSNNWLDQSLELLLHFTGGMKDFGLDTTVEREYLIDNLTNRAELVSGRILLTQELIAKIEHRLENDPANAQFNTELDLAKAGLDRYVERLATTARMMEALELNTADYQQLLFKVTGEITTGLLSREVLAGLLKSWLQSTMDWLTRNGPSLILKLVLFVFILLIFRFLSRIARRVVRKAIRRSGLAVSTLLERTALSVTSSVVMIFGLLVALSQLGFQIAPLLAGLGVAGFIVGFALQDTLSNFASGVMILLYRPYDVGDLVEAAGAFGNVKDMTLVSPTFLTLDHQTLVIPNNKIWGDVIKNVTAQTNRRIDMVFGIGYADDIPHAERVLQEIVDAHEKVLEDPEPVIRLHNLNESSVDFVVRPWVATDDYWDVYWDITREVKIRFDAEGISIPFPQRDVHVFQEGGVGEG